MAKRCFDGGGTLSAVGMLYQVNVNIRGIRLLTAGLYLTFEVEAAGVVDDEETPCKQVFL